MITTKIDITDNMIEFQKLKISIEKDDLIVVVGKQGTGKTVFVNRYLEKLDNIRIINIDKNTDEKRILKQLDILDMLGRKKVFLYDDFKVKNKFLYKIENKFKSDQIKRNNKFIVITNEYNGFTPINFSVHKLKYPKRHEVLRYLKELKINDKLIDIILSIPEYNLRRIQYTLEDGFYSGYDENISKFNLTNNNYILSMAIAENLNNLRKLKQDITEVDKYKYNNDHFYKDYLDLFYRDISKKKLRYPKDLINIKKGEKIGKV